MTAAADRARTISDSGPAAVNGALWSRTLSQMMCNSAAIAHSREKMEKAEECCCNEEDIRLWWDSVTDTR